MIQQVDLSLVRGDTFRRRFTITDLSGAVKDVSAWTFIGMCRANPDDAEPIATMTLDTTDAADGVVDASVADTATKDFTPPFVFYQVRATTDAGDVVTIGIGRLLVTKDSARA